MGSSTVVWVRKLSSEYAKKVIWFQDWKKCARNCSSALTSQTDLPAAGELIRYPSKNWSVFDFLMRRQADWSEIQMSPPTGVRFTEGASRRAGKFARAQYSAKCNYKSGLEHALIVKRHAIGTLNCRCRFGVMGCFGLVNNCSTGDASVRTFLGKALGASRRKHSIWKRDNGCATLLK